MMLEYLLTLYHKGMDCTVSTVGKKYLWNSGVFYVHTPTI